MKVILSRCDNDIEYVHDCLGYVIGFIEDYEDDEGNLYKVYYEAILEGDELNEMLENDCWENVADWDNPTDIKYYNNTYGSVVTKAIAKKGQLVIIFSGISLIEIGCTVEPAAQLLIGRPQLILDI